MNFIIPRFENGCSENSTQKLLTKYSTEENNKHVICRPRSVRIGKNCVLGLEYGHRLAASGRTEDLWHSFSQYGPPGRQITYMYLPLLCPRNVFVKSCLILYNYAVPGRWIVINNSSLMFNHNPKFLMQANLSPDVWNMQLETLHGIMHRVVDVSYRRFFYTTKVRFVDHSFNEQNSP